MSDLSRLLGDVYDASTPPEGELEAADPTTPTAVPAAADDPPAPPVEAGTPGPAAPGWADDAVLDEAFAEWVPGPPADASAEERGILADVEPAETVADEIDIDAWLGPDDGITDLDDGTSDEDVEHDLDPTTSVEALRSAPPEPEEHDEPDPNWTRTSDDLLPRGRRGRRLTLTLRR